MSTLEKAATQMWINTPSSYINVVSTAPAPRHARRAPSAAVRRTEVAVASFVPSWLALLDIVVASGHGTGCFPAIRGGAGFAERMVHDPHVTKGNRRTPVDPERAAVHGIHNSGHVDNFWASRRRLHGRRWPTVEDGSHALFAARAGTYPRRLATGDGTHHIAAPALNAAAWSGGAAPARPHLADRTPDLGPASLAFRSLSASSIGSAALAEIRAVTGSSIS
jgi:hypothetical protein